MLLIYRLLKPVDIETYVTTNSGIDVSGKTPMESWVESLQGETGLTTRYLYRLEHTYLEGLGYTGTIADMFKAFAEDNSILAGEDAAREVFSGGVVPETVYKASMSMALGQDVALPYINLSTLTYSLWVKTTVTTETNLISAQKTLGRVSLDTFKWWADINLSAHSYTATDITDGEWHHCVITHSGTTSSFYMDGAFVEAVTTHPIDTGNNSNRLGSFESTINFVGNIDDFRAYDRELSAAEVSDLYAGNAPASGLQVELLFDSYTANEDTSGNGRNATIRGATQDTDTWIT